jgi:hypothetical protein
VHRNVHDPPDAPGRRQRELTDRVFRVKIGQLGRRLIDHRLVEGRE